MIPQEVADIQDVLRERLPKLAEETIARIAWQIYNKLNENMVP